jgi:hypothetical protein
MALWTNAPIFVIKLALTAIVIAWAYIRPRWITVASYRTTLNVEGVTFKSGLVRQKNRANFSMYKSELQALAGASVDFNLENFWDRWFKQHGLAHEHQVGQTTFDNSIYIRSDSPSLRLALTTNQSLRDAIAAVFNDNGKWIGIEDGVLRVRHNGDQRENLTAQSAFARLNRSLSEIATRLTPNDDPFAKRARWIRALMCGLVPYGFLSCLDLFIKPRPDFIHLGDILILGLKFALPALTLACYQIFRSLKDSSRAPRLLSEFGLFLIFMGVPAGVGLTADLDRYFDFHRDVIVHRVVRSIETYVVRTSKGNRSHFSACFDPAFDGGRKVDPAAFGLPDCISISGQEFADFKQGDGTRFHIGPGLFNIPWYKKIDRLER